MPRKRSYSAHLNPYHVTARSHDREWFDLPMIQVWDIFSRYLYFVTLTFGVRIHAFVLMSNHFHLLLTAPNSNLDQALCYLIQEVSKAIEHESENANQVFAGSYHATAITNRVYYQQAYKYVYRNPVEARICSSVQAYPYSSLRGILGIDHLAFPAFDNLEMIVDPQRQLSWLNSPYPDISYLEEIHHALMDIQHESHDHSLTLY